MLVLSFESFKLCAQKNKKPLNFYPQLMKYTVKNYVNVVV